MLVGLAAVGIGCQSEPAADPLASQPVVEPKVESAVTAAPIESPAVPMTFVSLKVPNMV